MDAQTKALADAMSAAKPAYHGGGYDAGRALQWEHDVLTLTDVLASDNPRFDRDRFLTACGVPA